MYNIKQAAARAGVTVPVLRAWERRYGIVSPDRTASGYRQFDDADVDRIRTMRRLVDEGWSPSTAAAAINDGTVEITSAADALAGSAGTGNGARAAGEVEPLDTASVVDRFVDGARMLEPRAIASVLDDVFARGSFERVVTDHLFPALDALGDAWAAGTVSVAGEHLASNAVHRRLGQALDAAGPAPAEAAPRVLVGMPPGGRHELGALAFAVAARRHGIPVAYLGPDLPASDWESAAGRALAVVLGAVTPRDRTAGLDVANRLHADHPELVIAFGGRSAPTDPAYIRLNGDLAGSVAALAAALPGGTSVAGGR